MQADDRAHQGRLAGSRSAGHAEATAGGQVEVDAVQRGDPAAAVSEGGREAGDSKYRGPAGGLGWCGAARWDGQRACGETGARFHDVVGEPTHEVGVVAAQGDHDAVSFGQVAKEFADLVADVRVESGRRFAEEEDGGAAGRRAGEGDPPPSAAGETTGAAVGEVSVGGEPCLVEERGERLRAAVHGDFGGWTADLHTGVVRPGPGS